MNREMRNGCIGIVLLVLGFFWAVGFIGNHCDWIKAKCSSAGAGFNSARADAAERCSAWGERMRGRWQAHKDRIAAGKAAQEQVEAERRAEEERLQAAERKEMTLREFALKESPVLWKSVVQMRKDIAEQDVRIASLQKSIRDMGEDPEMDSDVTELKAQRGKMQTALDEVTAKLKKAYIESCKYQATLGQKEWSDFKRNATEEGAAEAEAAELRYGEMRKSK